MVKIVMFKTSLGSENGYDQPKEFLEEQEYDTTESLAEAFVNQGKAVYLSDIEKKEEAGIGEAQSDTSGEPVAGREDEAPAQKKRKK